MLKRIFIIIDGIQYTISYKHGLEKMKVIDSYGFEHNRKGCSLLRKKAIEIKYPGTDNKGRLFYSNGNEWHPQKYFNTIWNYINKKKYSTDIKVKNT